MKGLFIVFEGLDGSGKTTQILKLEQLLKTLELPIVRFFEPTKGKFGSKLRALFNQGHVIPIQDEIELSIKDRAEDVTTNLLPALKEGYIVLLDRYYWSNISYQGIVDDKYSLDYILEKSRDFPEPDVIIYFDIDVEVAIQRISVKRKPNVYESHKELSKSKTMYDKLIQNMPYTFSGKFIRINAKLSEDEVFNAIKHELLPIIDEWKKN